MEQYKGATFGELSPHPFAVADAAFRYAFGTLVDVWSKYLSVQHML